MTTVTVEKITPAAASKLLEGNTQNRSLKPRVVTAYARDMMTDRWADQGDPIRLNGDGTLLDGQHRLHAIVESGTTQSMVVVRGVSKKAILTMDTGAKRTFSDVLKLHGYQNVTQIAAAARFLMLLEQGSDSRGSRTGVFTNTEMLEWIEANDRLPSHVSKITNLGHHYVTRTRTPLIAIRHTADKASGVAEVDSFIESLRTGTNLAEGDPIHTLRRTLESLLVSKQVKVIPVVIHAITIKAWNAWLRGESASVLRFKPGGDLPEKFPSILTEA
jgi:hypothetical protein